MTLPSPLLPFFRDAGGVLMNYGPADMSPACDVVAALGPIELEYGSLRKHAALLDQPTRGVLRFTGPERLDFLNRMITQEMKGLAPMSCRRSFWLNRKGRIDADLRVIHLPDETLLDVDVLAAERTRKGLDSFIITEDCAITDVTQSMHRLALHGPRALDLLSLCAGTAIDLAQDRAVSLTIAGATVLVLRDDTAGAPGYELFVPTQHALDVVRELVAKGHDSRHTHEPGRAIALLQRDDPAASIRLQLIGWHAYNMARIEAGTPMYNMDFGPESLPAESGVLHDRVSFTKGCYLGQEVVARMHARGQSKQSLVAIKFERLLATDQGDNELPYPPLPEHRGAVALEGTQDAPGEVIGTITSAAPAPTLGMTPVAFAQVKSTHAKAGTVVIAQAEDQRIRGVIQATLAAQPAHKSAR
ncbi:MAG TPA: glycine cleavage T C-terminal barrel domain-containing protein [Phycisphaerales bacterium]|nr:glycine cleavage T C-terminal barrel domain-containing protein [Phycisphaerales bacterium]